VAPDDRLATLELPDAVVAALRVLVDAGHEAAVVGGAIRAGLRGVPHAADWDVATSAPPDVVAALLPGATWENRFGTVTVVGDPTVEITSYRTEGTYADRRRPDEVRFGVTLEEDLARRDFTVNAVAWVPDDVERGRGHLVDPHRGIHDLGAGVLRTVGDPTERFGEDALRLLRAPRFAATLGLEIEPRTATAIRELAPTVSGVSGERVRDELRRMLLAPRPSAAIRLLEALGLLRAILPEVADLRGVPQAKRVPGDALDHTFATVDAVPAGPGVPPPFLERLTALLHDVGKASTLADGHFIGHDRVGAELAARVLDRLRIGPSSRGRIVGAIRHHMYGYEPSWSNAAVRRFVRRTAAVDRDLLWALRRADDTASGATVDEMGRQTDLERRVAAEIEAAPALLLRGRLAVDGHDLQRELGIRPGPELGRLLDRLRDAAVADPTRDDRATLLALARSLHPVRTSTIRGAEPDAPG
jgi:tRNA nucleotidyltransferase (CCA-adding enzyme)